MPHPPTPPPNHHTTPQVFLEPSDRGLRRGSAGGRNDSRYFLLDKTLFCRRCHGVGHTAKFCPNPAKAKPCTVCAGTDGHEAEACPEWCVGVGFGLVGVVVMVCVDGRTDRPTDVRLMPIQILTPHQ